MSGTSSMGKRFEAPAGGHGAPAPVRALLVPVGDVPRPVMLPPQPDAINRLLGCDTFASAFREEREGVVVALLVDDEGKLDGALPNRAVTDESGRLADVVFGSFLVAAFDPETDDVRDLPATVEREYGSLFHDPTTGTMAVLQARLARPRKRDAGKTPDPRSLASRARAAAAPSRGGGDAASDSRHL